MKLSNVSKQKSAGLSRELRVEWAILLVLSISELREARPSASRMLHRKTHDANLSPTDKNKSREIVDQRTKGRRMSKTETPSHKTQVTGPSPGVWWKCPCGSLTCTRSPPRSIRSCSKRTGRDCLWREWRKDKKGKGKNRAKNQSSFACKAFLEEKVRGHCTHCTYICWNNCKLTKPDPKLEGLADVKDPTLGSGGFLFVHNEIYQVENNYTKSPELTSPPWAQRCELL